MRKDAAKLGRPVKASRKPGLKRPLVIMKNGCPVRRAPAQAAPQDSSSGVLPPLAAVSWGFPCTPVALLIFTNHWLLKQDLKMWGFFPSPS